ncbi:MAG: protein-L-isoaspartate O-methyltransferase [Halobacteriaceae archaeon]
MDFGVLREEMVNSLTHETKELVHTQRVMQAFREVPRHEFIDEGHRAYLDTSFEHRGTRVLSPSTAAKLIEALAPRPGDSTLVIGAGIGYTEAVIAEITGSKHVHAVDIDRQVVYDARSNLESAGYGNVLVDRADGAGGLPAYAPFDRILIEAACVDLPDPLFEQVTEGGRLVFPRGNVNQTLVAIEDDAQVAEFGAVEFAPLLVEGEQKSTIERNRTIREDQERAARAAKRRSGWERDWIDWDSSNEF